MTKKRIIPESPGIKSSPKEIASLEAMAIEGWRRMFEDHGEFIAFLWCLEFCGVNGYPLPAWVTKRVIEAVRLYGSHTAETLDEAFGAKRPKYYRKGVAQEGATKGYRVYRRCCELQNQGVKIGARDNALFEIVAKEFHMSASKVRDFYYSLKGKVKIHFS